MQLRPTIIIATTFVATACSTPTEQARQDEPPATTPAPSPAPPPPADSPDVAEEPVEDEPVETPAPATEAPPDAKHRYTGMPIVSTEVDRQTIRCVAQTEGASVDDNRRDCVRQLLEQVDDANHIIVVVDEMRGQGCPTCLALTADVTPVVDVGEAPRVVFTAQEAGTLQCTAGARDKTLEQTRGECYQVLREEAASLRAGIVLPLAIEEGDPCESCIAVAAQGFTVEVLAD